MLTEAGVKTLMKVFSAFVMIMSVIAIVLTFAKAPTDEVFVGMMMGSVMCLALGAFGYFWLPHMEFEI